MNKYITLILLLFLLAICHRYDRYSKKKRELRNQLNEGEESKGKRESNLDDFLANATVSNVFTESLKSENCVVILHNCMKKLMRK